MNKDKSEESLEKMYWWRFETKKLKDRINNLVIEARETEKSRTPGLESLSMEIVSLQLWEEIINKFKTDTKGLFSLQLKVINTINNKPETPPKLTNNSEKSILVIRLETKVKVLVFKLKEIRIKSNDSKTFTVSKIYLVTPNS